MNNTETSNRAGIINTNCCFDNRFEHPIFTPELCEDLVGLIDGLPVGARVGMECSQEMINDFPDDFDTLIKKIDRKKLFEEVTNKCNEKGIEMICLLDNALCVKGKKVYEDFKLGFENKIDFEGKTPYYGLEQVVWNNIKYFKSVELPDNILKNVKESNFDLVILSRETLTAIRKIDIEEVNFNKDIRLIQYDFNNYPDKMYEYNRSGVILGYLGTCDTKIIRKSV